MANRRWGRRTGVGSTKARQFGRIADDDWRVIKAACQRAGMSLTEWAVPTLLDKARRERGKIEAIVASRTEKQKRGSHVNLADGIESFD